MLGLASRWEGCLEASLISKEQTAGSEGLRQSDPGTLLWKSHWAEGSRGHRRWGTRADRQAGHQGEPQG